MEKKRINMWNPESIRLKRFMSHEDSLFTFVQNKLTLIFGKNEDDDEDGANSNGSGKSVPIEGITVALTGETYRDVPKDVMIMDEEESAEIDFSLNNTILGQHLRIHWIISRGKAARVFIYENNNKKHNEQITSVNEAKKYILDKIGISREDLLNFFIINQGNTNSFFSAGDAKQKEIIGRFANYDIINKLMSTFQSEKDVLDSKKSELESIINTEEGIRDSFLLLIEEERSEVATEMADEIELIEKSKEVKKSEISKHTQDLSVLLYDKKIVEDKLVVLTKECEDSNALIESSQDLYVEKSEWVVNKNALFNSNRNLNASLSHAITCPACEHNFILKSDLSIDEIKSQIDINESEISAIDSRMEELDEFLSEIDSVKVANSATKNSIKIENRKVATLIDDIDDLQSLISRNEKAIINLDKDVESLLNQEEKKSNIPNYEAKIQALELGIDAVKEELIVNSKEIDEKNYWLIHLGKKGFQTFLANKCIQVVEKLCNNFLEEMKVNIKVKINGYKLLANGELREKIDIQIIKNNSEGIFNKFSGGQKERVILAGILTFQKLINDSLKGKGLNLLCLDESLDYLDEKGQKVCLKILSSFDLTTVVISHNNVENLIEEYNKVLVTFKNSVSSIS